MKAVQRIFSEVLNMPYINKPIDRSQVMVTTFDELVAPDSIAGSSIISLTM